MRKLSITSLVFILLLTQIAKAQKTAILLHPDQAFYAAVDLYKKEKYNVAITELEKVQTKYKNTDLIYAECSFYIAASDLELFHKDAEWKLKQFIAQYPENKHLNEAYLLLGKSAFRKKKFEESYKWFQDVDIYELNKEELAELYFKRGYSALELGKNDKAKLDFYEIKDVDNKYATAGNYYYSHIAYLEKNYETALTGFNRLKNDEIFGNIVPYYITQIYFVQKKYKNVISDAPNLLKDSVQVQRTGEINGMIGVSYFKTAQYKEALPYLKKYYETGYSRAAIDNYQLGYCYYKTNDLKNALTYFEKATSGNDTVTQQAWYHIADCHLKNKDKIKSRAAFYSAYSKKANAKIKEDALFSYAKLSYELSYSPFDDAVKALTEYINEYPESSRKEEAYKYLINVYLTTKNYPQVIKSIAEIKNPEPQVLQAYQKALYFLGIENFNSAKYDDAGTNFAKSLKINQDIATNAKAKFWLAESNYQLKEYTTALKQFQEFQTMPNVYSTDEYDLANYSIGYCHFMNKDYASAGNAFKKVIITDKDIEPNKLADAYLRAADCNFMQREFKAALDYYSMAISFKKFDLDYAIYQKSICNGLLKNNSNKIKDLKELESNYPKSPYLASSTFELANTYANDGNVPEAVKYYNKVIKDYPKSSYIVKSYLGLAQLYYNNKDDNNAIKYYDEVVKRDKGSPDAQEAAGAIKKIYESQGKLDELQKYYEANGYSISKNELDSIAYSNARNAYMENNFVKAEDEFEKYLSKFPSCIFLHEAHFYFAEACYKNKKESKALPSYTFLINKPRSTNTETILLRAAWIEYKNKNYNNALAYYLKLNDMAEVPQNKAIANQYAMKAAFNVQKYDTAIDQSNKYLGTEKLSTQQIADAKFIRAKSYFELGRTQDALLEFSILAKGGKSQITSESMYYKALCMHKNNDYVGCEKAIETLIKSEVSDKDVSTKAMILLADNYAAQNDMSSAQATLEAVIDNTSNGEFLKLANDKLAKLKQLQSKSNGMRTNTTNDGGDMKIEYKSDDNTKSLFNENKTIEDLKNEKNNSEPKR
jgi:TolA-binding protein